MLGGLVVGAMVAVAALSPWIAPYPYAQTRLAYGARPPSWAHPLGTDELGRDLLTRIMWGARVSLGVGILATLVSLTIGVSYGAVSGYAGGRADRLMMRIVDILYGLPFMFFVIILVVAFGRSVFNLFIALGAVQWLTMARIVRGQVLSLREREFVLAARAGGAGTRRVIAAHVLPNALGPIVVYATLTVPAVMLEEAFLSFLGLGVQPPMASWGSLASEGAAQLDVRPWLILFPGLALTITLFSLNFLGDGLRDALDPQVTR
jgi:oligopeptide transport system permease protein